MKGNKQSVIIKIVLITTSIFLGVAFFLWTVYPNLQITAFHRAYQKAIKTGDTTLLTNRPFLFEPYTHVQPMLRYLYVALLTKGYAQGDKDFIRELLPSAIEKQKETLVTTAPYFNSYLFLAKAHDILGLLSPDRKITESYMDQATEYYEKALTLAPNHQAVISQYGLNLYNRGKMNEAIKLYRDSLAIESRVPQLHYFLGVFLVYQNENNSAEALTEIETALDQNSNPNPEQTKVVYHKLLSYFGNKKDKVRVLITLERLIHIDSKQKELYTKIIDYIQETGRIPELEFDLQNNQ